MTRVVGHLDLDYFYAQVEEIENPALRDLPLVVCVYSGRTEDSGVVSTANYKARELGVKSAIPIAAAKRLLEGTSATFLPMNHGKYQEYSNRVMEILGEQVDIMEQTGIDEAFFDITKKSAEDYETATKIAVRIKTVILEKEKLTCSIGLAPNKIIAKLASDFKKPDGLTSVPPSRIPQFLGPTSVEKLYGVGPKSANILKGIGIVTVADLAGKDLDELDRVLDHKFSIYLHDAANGVNDEPVVESGEVTQLSRMITLKRNSREVQDIVAQLSPAITDLQSKITNKEVFFHSVSVIGVLPDLSTKTRSRTLNAPTRDFLSLGNVLTELFTSLLDDGRELRRAGIRVSDLTKAKAQRSLVEFFG
ncbi:MAG: DNA polymerase IV [Nitrososphaerota archaeon]|nr:DNA polymerase IV [Nitrososphaerota archaeon]